MRARILSTSIALALTYGSLHAEDLIVPDPPESKREAGEVTVRVYEQVSPKPLGALPEGWKLEKLTGHSTKQPPVLLPNGESTNITTSAYCLVPEATPGSIVFVDPGFDSTKGNAQKATIGAVLTDHVEAAALLNTRLNTNIAALREALRSTSPSTAANTPVPAPRRKQPQLKVADLGARGTAPIAPTTTANGPIKSGR